MLTSMFIDVHWWFHIDVHSPRWFHIDVHWCFNLIILTLMSIVTALRGFYDVQHVRCFHKFILDRHQSNGWINHQIVDVWELHLYVWRPRMTNTTMSQDVIIQRCPHGSTYMLVSYIQRIVCGYTSYRLLLPFDCLTIHQPMIFDSQAYSLLDCI